MKGTYQILNLDYVELNTTHTFTLDVLNGLTKSPKSLPSKYLYDDRGSALFSKITEQEEYYPTNCELEILNRFKNQIRMIVQEEPFRLVELGVGDARKTKALLDAFLDHGLEFEYVLIDCCQEVIHQVVATLKREYQNLPLHVIGIVAEYSTALSWLSENRSLRNILLFLGSSIGNFDSLKGQDFLREIWNTLNDKDYALIGFDLKKDITILERAYNDTAGVTKEFNLNILDRLNRELGANFNKAQFMHHSFYNPSQGRIESWIISTKIQEVTIQKIQKSFVFEPWEGIHLENSYKYNLKGIEKLAEASGFVTIEEFTDTKGYFINVFWQVDKTSVAIAEVKR